MARWIQLKSNQNAMDYASKYHVHPLLIQILANRGIQSEEELDAFFSEDLSASSSYQGLPDIDRAKELLIHIKEEGTRLRIIGDYDVDGVLSTVILVKGLKAFGIEADYVIPHRVTDGYGMNVRLIEEAKKDGVGAILTCDNGISAHEEIKLAKKFGMTVIVTDHHEVAKEGEEDRLPVADAVVNPKRKESAYPMREICGAQVAYKLISALLGFDREIMQPDLRELKEELMMFSGLAALEDVMPLVSENHRLVKWAISRVRTSPNKGLHALLMAKDLSGKELKSYHIGFLLGPCINASGRLDSAMRAAELFLSDSDTETEGSAAEIVRLNEERKNMTMQAEEKAVAQVEGFGMLPKVLVVYLPDTHESIAGIVAGRIRERYMRPTFVLTDSADGIKGSARSVEAYSMYEALARHSELFKKFGGHKMAAGLSLKDGCLEEFRHIMNEDCDLTDEDFMDTVKIDAVVPFSEFTCELVEQLDILEPFGAGNEKPLFATRNVRVCSLKRFGKNQEYLSVNVEEGGRYYSLKTFRNTEEVEACLKAKYGDDILEHLAGRRDVFLHVAYTPMIDEYMGNRKVAYRLEKCM